jgi:long-chain acyl-CoA synthetase
MISSLGPLERWAQERPAEIAMIEDERALSYVAWNDAANRVANSLARHGVDEGDIVVVRTHIRLEWAVIGSALAKLGCSLLALNWRLTPAEVRHLLADSGASAFVCDDADPTALLSTLRERPMKVHVSIDVEARGFVTFDNLLDGPDTPRESLSDPSLIVYTSGTTGPPRGVVMGRGSRFFTSQQVAEYQSDVRNSRHGNAERGTMLITMPMHHRSGPAQVWGGLRAGRRIVMMRRFDPEGALALIQKHRVTDWSSVPTMLKRIAALPPAVLARYDVSSIKRLNVGAAPVPYSLKEWALSYFGESLSEGYGSTETGMVTRLSPDMQRAKPGSSGRPFKHVSIEVRDANGAVLPPGQTGELWIRTPTTLGHYLDGGNLGADTLDANGFFRVGDVGHLDEEGYLYLTDRAKDMIVSGGVSIYPAEIENVLIRHPAILDAAVIGVPDVDLGERAIAFCELKPDRGANEKDLLKFAGKHLTSYKLPRAIEFVAELPRNTIGQILKHSLREPYWKDQARKI